MKRPQPLDSRFRGNDGMVAPTKLIQAPRILPYLWLTQANCIIGRIVEVILLPEPEFARAFCDDLNPKWAASRRMRR